MALVITFTSLNLTDVGTIKAHAEEINDEVVSSVSGGEIINDDISENETVIDEIIGEESKKDVSSLVTDLYMADLFNFDDSRHPYAFGDYRNEGMSLEAFDKKESPQTVDTITHYAFRFYDAALDKFIPLTVSDLAVSKTNPKANDFSDIDEPVLHYDLDGEDDQDYQIYELEHNVTGVYTISYVYPGDGKTYSVEIHVGFPGLALYTAAEMNDENLIKGWDYYYCSGDKFYILSTRDDLVDYTYSIFANGKQFDNNDIFIESKDENDNTVLTLKEGIDFEFDFLLSGYEFNNPNSSEEKFYHFIPGTGILSSGWIESEWDEEQQKGFFRFVDYDEESYTRFDNSREYTVGWNTPIAFAYIERHKDGSVYAEPIDIKDCSLTFNGEEKDISEYFEYCNSDIYSSGGKHEGCPEELNGEYKIYILFSSEVGTFVLTFEKGGKTYTYSIECTLPEVGIYSKNERSANTLINSLDYSSTNKTVYMLTGKKEYEWQEDLRIESIEIDKDSENLILSGDEIKDYVTVTKVTNGFKLVFTDKIGDCYRIGFNTNYNWCTLFINDCRPCLRICDWLDIHWDDEEQRNVVEGFHFENEEDFANFMKEDTSSYIPYTDTYFFALAYVKDNTYKPIKLSDIKITCNGVNVKNSLEVAAENIPYTFDDNNNKYDIYRLTAEQVGNYIISYDPTPENTKNKDVVTMTISCRLPEIAAYSNDTMSSDSYLGFDIFVNNSNDSFYILSEDIDNYRFESFVQYYSDGREEPAAGLEEYFDFYEVENGRKVRVKKIDTLIESELHLKVLRHDCWEEDESCPGRDYCDNYREDRTIFIRRMNDPQLEIYDNFKIDWGTGRFIGFEQGPEFYRPDGNDRYLYVNEDFYVSFTYCKDTGNNRLFTPITLDKIKVYKDGSEVDPSTVFTVIAKALPYNGSDQEGLGNKYDVYKLNTDKSGTYTVKYDPDSTNDTDEDAVVVNFKVSFDEYSFYSKPEESDETYLGSNARMLAAINSENNVVYFKASNPEANYKLYTLLFDEQGEQSFGDLLYDSASPADNFYPENGVKITTLENGMLEISYNGLHEGLTIVVNDEDLDEEWGYMPGLVAGIDFMTLNIFDENIKATYAVGEEVKKNDVYIDYFDTDGRFLNASAADIEKLGYTLKFEYAEFMPDEYTLEPNADGKLILSVPGIYKWNLYKGDELYAEGHNCAQVFKKVYTPVLGKEIEIAGTDEYEDDEDIMRGYDQVVKIFVEGGMTYKITVYPSDSKVEDYDRYVSIEGMFYNEENEQFEYGNLGEGTAKYIFFRAQSDGDVLIKPFAGCKEKIKIEKCSDIYDVWIEKPDDFEYWSDGENYIGAAPEDMAKVLVYTEEGIQEYNMLDIVSFLDVNYDYYEVGKARVTYSGQINSIPVNKSFDVVVLPESPVISIGETITDNGFYKLNLTKDSFYEIKANDYDEEGLRILLMYQAEDGNIETVLEKNALCVNMKAEETGTYFLLVDGLVDNELVIRERKKTIEPAKHEDEPVRELVYGFNPSIENEVGGAIVYYDGVESTRIYLFDEILIRSNTALYGFKYDLVKEDKVTPAKKDTKGFYPVGNYYYRFTVDGNYDAEPEYSDLIKIVSGDTKYAITYHVNGKTIKQTDIKPNTVFNLRANTEQKKGYTFLGWAVEDNGDITEDIIINRGDASPVFFTDKQKVSNLYIPERATTDLWAVWERNVYTVEYYNLEGTSEFLGLDSAGNEIPFTVEYTVDDAFEMLSPNVVSSEYSGFDGWYTDANLVNKITEIKPTDAKNYVLYAKLNRTSYTINFSANGGSGTEMKSLTVYDGMEIKIPACSYKNTGYTFYAWASNPEYGMLFWGNETVRINVFTDGDDKKISFVNVEEDTTTDGYLLDENNNLNLYAYWSNEFHILYHNISGSEYTEADVAEGQSLEYNKEFKTLLKPTRAGYTFSGWYNEAGKKVTSITPKGEKLTYHLYAKWTAKSYNVKFDKNGGTSGSMDKQKLTFDKVANLKANKFVRPGYEFRGWSKTKLEPFSKDAPYIEIESACDYHDNGEALNVSEEGKDITLYAVWVETDYVITFDPCCETWDLEGYISSLTYSYSKDIGEALPIISRDGYEFKGWYKDAKYSKAITNTKGLYADMTVYAKWAATYTIVFYGNGGTGSTKAISGVKLNEVKKLTKNGFSYKDEIGNKYAFMGWSTVPYAWEPEFANEEKIKISSPNYLLEENGKYVLNLYAIWRKDFSVMYLTNGGSLANYTDFYVYGTGMKSLPTPVRDGYTFGGWYKDEKFKTKKVTSISATNAGDVELYAKWTGSKYSITFNANAPEGTKASGKMKAESLVYGTEKALTKNAFKVTGYKFVGWSKSPMGPVEFGNGEKVDSIFNLYKSKVTLYAVWEYVPSYVTVYVSGAEDFSYNIDDESRIGETITFDEINAVFRDENGSFYFYDKLYTDKACKKLFKGTKITSGEIKLYAKKRTQILY